MDALEDNMWRVRGLAVVLWKMGDGAMSAGGGNTAACGYQVFATMLHQIADDMRDAIDASGGEPGAG